jgi:tetratricopeptide (TPR) repeat protein
MNITKLIPALSLLLFIGLANNAHAQTVTDYQTKGDVALATRDFKTALENYKLAIKKSDKKDTAKLQTLYFDCAVCQDGMGNDADALKSYTSALNADPHFRNAYWNRGVINQKNKNYKLAIDDFNSAIANTKDGDTGNNILYANIAYNEMRSGDFTKALAADSLSIVADPGYSRAYIIKAEIYSDEGNYLQADENYSQVIANYNNNNKQELSYIFSDRGEVRLRSQRYKDAINDFSYAVLLNPDNGVAYWNRAATYHRNGDFELAANDYTKAMNYYKDDSESLSRLYVDRAMNELGLNLFDKALQDDSVAIVLNSKNIDAYIDKAIAYTQGGNYSQSIVYYKQLLGFLKDKKQQAAVYYEIANNEYFLNEFDKVIADCTRSISLDTLNAESYYYRAKVYLKKTSNKNLAIADFNKVLALDTTKKSVGYIFSLVYLGRPDEAIAILQNNVLTATNNATILSDYYNLACLYAIINKADEANVYLKKAIDSGYSKKYAMADEDLDNIRNTNDYKSTIGSPGQ